MTDRELLELIAAQVGKLTIDVDGFRNDFTDVKNDMTDVRNDLTNVKNDLTDVKSDIKKIHMTIEHDIQPKLTALYDGQKQLNQKLERVEQEVSKHDEVIWKRVK